MEIWREGYRITGNESPAALLAVVDAPNLKAACDAHAAADPDWAKHYNPERMTYWGCRLFDNEAEASCPI
jgi:hypothetical protein